MHSLVICNMKYKNFFNSTLHSFSCIVSTLNATIMNWKCKKIKWYLSKEFNKLKLQNGRGSWVYLVCQGKWRMIVKFLSLLCLVFRLNMSKQFKSDFQQWPGFLSRREQSCQIYDGGEGQKLHQQAAQDAGGPRSDEHQDHLQTGDFWNQITCRRGT